MPTTTERGYGYSHQRERARWQQQINRGLVRCWRCGGAITARTRWHLGHDDWDRSITRGPEHARCNLSAAGRKAGMLKRARRAVRNGEVGRLRW